MLRFQQGGLPRDSNEEADQWAVRNKAVCSVSGKMWILGKHPRAALGLVSGWWGGLGKTSGGHAV